ncbi:hypothetical protein BKA69DRAFT_1094478, partial [Paraphysoderma sedebokerense]
MRPTDTANRLRLMRLLWDDSPPKYATMRRRTLRHHNLHVRQNRNQRPSHRYHHCFRHRQSHEYAESKMCLFILWTLSFDKDICVSFRCGLACFCKMAGHRVLSSIS